MVTLRKNSSTPKLLFNEGERVLCYEPDPNKAKVLYDSKILEIIFRDGCTRGIKKVEYLVHFYGWNSSWDRYVSEENILKDTEENRILQRQLAEQAACFLKGKKLKLNKIPAIIKEVVISSLNEQEDQNAKDGYEQTNNLETIFGEDSSNSNMFTTTNSTNSIANDLELSIQSNQIVNNFHGAMSAIDNQANLNNNESNHLNLNIINNLTNNTHLVNDNQNIELCQQIITNLDKELKSILEKDQNFICLKQTLYKLPVKSEQTVHKILNSFENFTLDLIKGNFSDLINYENQQNIVSNFFPIVNSNDDSTKINSTINSKQSLKELNFELSSTFFTCQTIKEFTNSIEIYFNTLIEKKYLFYTENEKQQYNKIQSFYDHKPIDIFGYIHLLRLIIILPEFLSICSIPIKQMKKLIFLIKNFCKFLIENQIKFFTQE